MTSASGVTLHYNPRHCGVTPDNLARELEQFLAEARDAMVLEDGEPIFEMASTRYSISADRGSVCCSYGHRKGTWCGGCSTWSTGKTRCG